MQCPERPLAVDLARWTAFAILLGLLIHSTFLGRFLGSDFLVYINILGAALLGYAFAALVWDKDPFHALRPIRPLLASWWIFLLLVLAQMPLHFFPVGSQLGTQSLYPTYLLLPLAASFLGMVPLLIDSWRSEKDVAFFVEIVLLIGLVAALYIGWFDIAPKAWGKGRFFLERVEYRSLLAFANRNHASFFFNLLLPVLLLSTLASWMRAFSSRHRELGVTLKDLATSDFWRRFVSFAFVLLIAASLGSRAGWVALTAGLVSALSFALLYEKKRGRDFLPMLLVMVSFLLLAAIGLFYFLGAKDLAHIQDFAGRLMDVVTGKTSDLDGRAAIYGPAFGLFLERPLLGFGLGSFSSIFMTVHPSTLAAWHVTYAHNEYLELLIETGFLGFAAAFLIPLITVLVLSINFLKQGVRDIPRKTFYLLAGISGALVGAAVHSASDFSLKMMPNMFVLIFWFAAFLKLTTNEPARLTTLGTSAPIGKRLILASLVLASLSPFIFLRGAALLSDRAAQNGNIRMAIAWSPYRLDLRYRILSKMMHLKRRYPSQTILDEANKILAIDSSAFTYEKIGYIYRLHARRAEAMEFYAKALRKAPQESRIIFGYASNIIELLNKDPKETEKYEAILVKLLRQLDEIALQQNTKRMRQESKHLLWRIKSDEVREKISQLLETR